MKLIGYIVCLLAPINIIIAYILSWKLERIVDEEKDPGVEKYRSWGSTFTHAKRIIKTTPNKKFADRLSQKYKLYNKILNLLWVIWYIMLVVFLYLAFTK